MSTDKTIGVVGLGIMGGAISGSLAASGWSVAGYDIDLPRQAEASSNGVQIKATIEDLISCADIFITSLPNAVALHSFVRAMSTIGIRKTVIETSTLSLEDKMEAQEVLEAAGHLALDCPISGTGAQAKLRDLVIYASGNSQYIAELKSVFLSFARQVFDVGEFGNGTRVKFVANLLVAINNVATAEAMVLASRAGLDLNRVAEWISAGAASSRIFEKRAPLMAADSYTPATMKLSVWQKDLDVISRFARDLGSPTPVLDATCPVYAAAIASRPGDEDTASVYAVLQVFGDIPQR
jgi:3-hydroxyisobutyrate dehydrogenase-like beta-hydroxyacid dehydrogenase